jgi:hypothetical protein
MEKRTLPELLAAELKPESVRGRTVRLCFQDEARFGRMVRFRRCWAPSPLRPKVANGYEREFTYVYGAVSPWDGQLDWCLSSNRNTSQMNEFIHQVRLRAPPAPDQLQVRLAQRAALHDHALDHARIKACLARQRTPGGPGGSKPNCQMSRCGPM